MPIIPMGGASMHPVFPAAPDSLSYTADRPVTSLYSFT
jgi:hypothetical protein